MRHHRTWSGMMLFFSILAVAIWTAPPVHAQPETLTIAAANSLKEALGKVLPLFEAQHREISVRVIYGPSQTLRNQIEQGAPVDVFLPSLFEEIDQLEKKGLVIQGTKRAYAGTSLVLITGTALPAPVGSIHDLQSVPVRRHRGGRSKDVFGGESSRSIPQIQQSRTPTQIPVRLRGTLTRRSRSRCQRGSRGRRRVSNRCRLQCQGPYLGHGAGRIPYTGPLWGCISVDSPEYLRLRRVH